MVGRNIVDKNFQETINVGIDIWNEITVGMTNLYIATQYVEMVSLNMHRAFPVVIQY